LPIPDAATVAQRWVAGAQAGSQRYIDGVQTTQKDVVGLAVAQGQKALINYQAAITSGHWARKLLAVGNAGWKQAVAAKGGANFVTGVTAAQQKFATAMGPVLAQEATLQAQIDAMPKTTIADSVARATAWINGMHQWKLSQG
jgi:hypothetical protein